MSFEIPSDFDPYELLTELPLQPEEIYDPALEFTQEHQATTFSDDLEAIREVAQERVDRLTKERVVIQHRQKTGEPLFRSSSLPPVSPTPRARTHRPRNITESRDSSPSPVFQLRSSQLVPSSPPQMADVAPPPADQETSIDEVTTPTDQTPKVQLPTNFKPTFGNLSGGLFSKQFAKPVKKPTDDDSANEKTPTQESARTVPAPFGTSSNGSMFTRAPLRKEDEEVTIITNTGNTIKVKRKEKGAPSTETIEITPEVGANKFFGVDIYSILEEAAATKQPSRTAQQAVEESILAPVSGNTGKQKRRLLWSEKYRAKRFTDLVGDERTHRHVMRWLKSWDPIVFPGQAKPKPTATKPEEEPEMTKVLMLYGPPGLGKTTLAHVAARQAGYEPFEINASDDRSRNVVEGKIKDMLTIEGVKSCGLKSGKNQKTVSRPVCLIIDEIDGVTGGGGGSGAETGFIKSLIDLIQADQRSANTTQAKKRRGKNKDVFKMNRPIIAVCNDLYAPALKPLRALAETVQMRAPPKGLIEDRLEWIFSKEGYATEDGAVRKMVELSAMGSSSGHAGDMRSALVNAEWISARLKQNEAKGSKSASGRKVLTRKIVEEELGGIGFGKNDGKGSSGGRASIKDVVESVFTFEKEVSKTGVRRPGSKSSTAKIGELVDALGEFDKITMDCFTSYPKRQFHDDFILTKPNQAYDWLWFSDLLSSRAFTEQHHSLSSYLSQPIVAFHHLFASVTGGTDPLQEEDDSLPFSGPNADWEYRESSKENKAMAQNAHSSLTSIRLSQTFKAQDLLVTELVPFANLMLAPRVSPVVVGGSSGFGVASVRRESERKLVEHAVRAMEATGVRFDKMRVEVTPGEVAGSGWVYRMDPPLDQLDTYTTLSKESVPVKYAVRQVLDQEWRKSKMLREKTSREARMGALNGSAAAAAPAKTASDVVAEKKRGRDGKKVKRDFFGRIIVEKEEPDGAKPSKKRKTQGAQPEVWVSFNEGFSNAVRKGIRLGELLDGIS